MTQEEIQANKHYKPAGISPVCGFSKTVMEREAEADTPNHPLGKIQGTTDVRHVTCPKCHQWLRIAVAQYTTQYPSE